MHHIQPKFIHSLNKAFIVNKGFLAGTNKKEKFFPQYD